MQSKALSRTASTATDAPNRFAWYWILERSENSSEAAETHAPLIGGDFLKGAGNRLGKRNAGMRRICGAKGLQMRGESRRAYKPQQKSGGKPSRM